MRIALALAALFLVGACSTDGTTAAGKVDYKTAKTLPPLDIPPDLSAPSRDGGYALPEGAKTATTLSGYQAGRTMQATPGTGSVLPVAQGMRVERDGRHRVRREAGDLLLEQGGEDQQRVRLQPGEGRRFVGGAPDGRRQRGGGHAGQRLAQELVLQPFEFVFLRPRKGCGRFGHQRELP